MGFPGLYMVLTLIVSECTICRGVEPGRLGVYGCIFGVDSDRLGVHYRPSVGVWNLVVSECMVVYLVWPLIVSEFTIDHLYGCGTWSYRITRLCICADSDRLRVHVYGYGVDYDCLGVHGHSDPCNPNDDIIVTLTLNIDTQGHTLRAISQGHHCDPHRLPSLRFEMEFSKVYAYALYIDM
ncbi:hypothetical protein J6590_073069 [Homalodisca vitripennis]|nr:hypothetical protein J6590_073069 [Homalodisca vitripennis]